MKQPHRCPRCQEKTVEKYYCRPCREVLKRPPIPTKGKGYYYCDGYTRRTA